MQGYFDLLTFSFENMTFTMKMVSGALMGNYKGQLLHIFRAYQPAIRPVHFVILTI